MKRINSLISHLKEPNFFYRIIKKIGSYLFFNQWIVLVGPNTGYKLLNWKNLTPLPLSPDRFWADPFIIERGGQYYLFIEEALQPNNRGRISCLTLDKALNIVAHQVILDLPYHLSYPFLFEHQGELYMIPESGFANRVDLYKCLEFPAKWEFEKTLIHNVFAVDATVVEVNKKWWLFTNIKDTDGSTERNLYLYFSDDPLSENWTSHPMNPIVRDINSARPAGRIFQDNNGILIRPSQDGSIRYGYAINFNRIIKLSETDYKEIREHYFAPPKINLTNAAHTFNASENLVAIDAKKIRFKFW